MTIDVAGHILQCISTALLSVCVVMSTTECVYASGTSHEANSCGCPNTARTVCHTPRALLGEQVRANLQQPVIQFAIMAAVNAAAVEQQLASLQAMVLSLAQGLADAR